MMDWNSTLTNFSWIWEEPNFEETTFCLKRKCFQFFKNDINVSSLDIVETHGIVQKFVKRHCCLKDDTAQSLNASHLSVSKWLNFCTFAACPQSVELGSKWWCLRIVTFSAIHFFQKTHNSVKDDSHNWFDIAFSPLYSTVLIGTIFSPITVPLISQGHFPKTVLLYEDFFARLAIFHGSYALVN